MSSSDSPWSKVAGVVLVQVILMGLAFGGLSWTGIDVVLDRERAGLHALAGVPGESVPVQQVVDGSKRDVGLVDDPRVDAEEVAAATCVVRIDVNEEAIV